MAYLLNHLYKFEINVGTAATPKWAVIAKGIKSVDPDNNEEVEEDFYYDGGGASERSVIGFMMTYAFEGHRSYGDEAQDFIFKKVNQIGDARKTDFRVTEPNGDKWEGPSTISEIKVPGGDANSKGEIEFNIAFDGAPEFTEKASA